MSLNKGQQIVFQQLQEFLASEHTFFSLESGGGYGKTYLLNHLKDKIPELNTMREVLHLPVLGEMIFTATTNKAATLLGHDSSTVFKLFKIRPVTNYKINKTTYQVGDSLDLTNEILVVDEGSMLAPEIFQIISDKVTQNAKVIFALDPYQLAPVGYAAPIVNQLVNEIGIPRGELTEPMRQDVTSHLFRTCDMLRMAVKEQVYKPITQGEGVRFVSAADFQKEYLEAFRNHEDARIIAHSNDQVELHNNHIRKTLYGTSKFQVGDPVVAASAMPEASEIRVEESYVIRHMSEPQTDKYLDYYLVNLGLSKSFKVPVNKTEYFKKLKRAQIEAKKSGDWTTYFTLKNNYLDIRDAFACTAHKAQGSTYDKVFLDFANLTSCYDLNTFLRALYVAVSRARVEVIIYGL